MPVELLRLLKVVLSILTIILLMAYTVQCTAGGDGGWTLLATDPDEGSGVNIKAVYYKVSNGLLYFKIVYYRNWSSIEDLDTGLLIDVDLNYSTGYDVDTYPNANTGLGAEYLIVIGVEAQVISSKLTCMVKAGGRTEWNISYPIPPDYYDIPTPGNEAIVAYSLDKFEGAYGVMKIALTDAASNWDWCPDSGNLIVYLHPTIVGGEIDLNTPTIQTLTTILAVTAIILTTILTRQKHKT